MLHADNRTRRRPARAQEGEDARNDSAGGAAPLPRARLREHDCRADCRGGGGLAEHVLPLLPDARKTSCSTTCSTRCSSRPSELSRGAESDASAPRRFSGACSRACPTRSWRSSGSGRRCSSPSRSFGRPGWASLAGAIQMTEGDDRGTARAAGRRFRRAQLRGRRPWSCTGSDARTRRRTRELDLFELIDAGFAHLEAGLPL